MDMRTRFRVEAQTLIIDLHKASPVLSSAPRGGGFRQSRYILNHQVAPNPVSVNGVFPQARAWEDPSRYLGRIARHLDVDRRCVALMTAVPLEHLVLGHEQADEVWVEAFVTVGLSNAVRAGEAATVGSHPGTINIVLITNAALSPSAMVGALQVAVESKTAALLAERVMSWTGSGRATGTGTDALAIASGDGPSLLYSGTHTKFGSMLGRVVETAVCTGIGRWNGWKDEQC